MGVKFPDDRLSLGKLCGHFRPLCVTGQAFRYKYPDRIGMPDLFSLCGPQLKNIVSGQCQYLSCKDHRQAVFPLVQADNIQIFSGLHQQIPGPALRNQALNPQLTGQVVVLPGQHLSLSLDGPVLKLYHLTPPDCPPDSR